MSDEPPFNPDEPGPCAVCSDTPSVVGINRRWYCPNHIDAGMSDAFALLREADRG